MVFLCQWIVRGQWFEVVRLTRKYKIWPQPPEEKNMIHRVLLLVIPAVIIAATLPGTASARVYCTSPGIPAGCVVRPGAAAAVIHCTAPGVPAGCVARPAAAATPGAGAPGIGVRPGIGAGTPGIGGPANRGGPVNRPGVR